jgi:DNA-directed RNA polymerase subunit F
MKNIWSKQGSNFFLGEGATFQNTLESGVYKTQTNPQTGEMYLTFIGDKFLFPYKVYGIESDFISRVKKTYQQTTGNLGILLDGLKGTGKTVTSELIANSLEQPTIIVNHVGGSLSSFINALPQNTTLLFDEYEKLYKNGRDEDGNYQSNDDAILSVMDGALNNEFRKVFLLTTNKEWINENLMQRPGRIRYIKTFSDLSIKTIMEIVDDLLDNEDLREETIKYVSELELITVDIVKAVLSEVNIHNEAPEKFKSIFNAKSLGTRFDIYEVKEGVPDLIFKSMNVNIRKFTPAYIGMNFNNGIEHLGRVCEIIGEREFKVRVSSGPYDKEPKENIRHLFLKEIRGIHESFAEYAY